VGIFSLTPGGMLGDVLKTALTGPLVGGLVDGYKAKLAAGNNTDTILADIAGKELMVDQRQRELDAMQNQMEQGSWFTRSPRAIVQWSLSIYIAKCVVWDMVLGLGTTPDIKSTLIANAFNLIIVMWFGGRTLEKISSTITSRIGKK
jgi:hypothetical protein